MKNIKIITLMFALIAFAIGCEESTDDPYGVRGTAVAPVISNVNPAFFLASDVQNSYIEFDVALPEGESVDGGSVLVSLNDLERKQVATISSFPSKIKITGGEIATALGIATADIAGGDVITLEVLTTKNGKTTRSNVGSFTAAVACTYNPDLPSGVYNAYSDPDSWAINGDITLEVDSVDNTTIYVRGLSELDGLTEDGGPLVMHIDLSTFKVTVDYTVLASVGWQGYTNAAYEGTGSYSSCDGTFELNLTMSVDEGSFGSYPFTFTKK